MFSLDDQDGILEAVGGKFLAAVATSVRLTQADIEEMKGWRPSWFPVMASRTLANLIHDRMWAHLSFELDSDPEVVFRDKPPHRHVTVSGQFRLRLKRHDESDRIRTYRTREARAFWQQDPPAFPGLEMIKLAAGYRWDATLQTIGPAVISLRDGVDNPVWSVELVDTAGAAAITWTPIGDDDTDLLPVIDTTAVDDQVAEGGDGSR